MKTLFVSPFKEGDGEEEEDEDEERRVTAVAAASPVLLPKSCTLAKHSRSTSLLNSKPMQISDNLVTNTLHSQAMNEFAFTSFRLENALKTRMGTSIRYSGHGIEALGPQRGPPLQLVAQEV